MIDERGLISQFEAADAEEMIDILDRPTLDEEKALRAHLGDHLYQRMHGLALRCRIQRERERPRGNVVVIPGFIGSELRLNEPGTGKDDRLWLNIPRIMEGGLGRLRLGEDGLRGVHPSDDVHASGLLKRQYGELLLTLARHWDVRGFAYDWRKDLEQASGDLLARINGWFGVDEPVHLVAHGMGGMVARAFIGNQHPRWESMKPGGPKGRSGGRLVMLGTANHGSFMALRALTGLGDLVRDLSVIDKHHDHADLLKIVQSFVSFYQMLPSPIVDPRMKALYDVDTYGELHVSKRHLRKAMSDQTRLLTAVDEDRMVQVLGYGFRTFTNVADLEKVTQAGTYKTSPRGDGLVALDYAILRRPDGQLAEIPTFYLREHHAGLTSSPIVLASIDELLVKGTTSGFDREDLSGPDGFDGVPEDGSHLDDDSDSRGRATETRAAVNHIDMRGASAGSRISPEEASLSDVLVRGLTMPVAMTRVQPKAASSMPIPTIEFAVVTGRVSMIEYDRIRSINGDHPIDVVAVGHYVGVKPQGQELELDDAISMAQLRRLGVKKDHLEDSDRLLTLYSERGIIRGELGQPFFLDDPRAKRPGDRLIAIAGMGLPGRFGVPELSVLARELVWSVGRLGRRHLCVAPIGTRNGNLSVEDAIAGWVRGIKAALTGVDDDNLHRIRKISFVASDPRKIWRYDKAIRNEEKRLEKLGRLKILYTPLTEEQIRGFQEQGRQRDRDDSFQAWERESTPGSEATRSPTRVTLGYDRKLFRFGAITEDASIPERTISLDPELVDAANKELAAEADPNKQLERGRFLERLVVPNELRRMMASNAPLVMMMDSTTARIHWEMAATTDPIPTLGDMPVGRAAIGGALDGFEFGNYFLGTSRGFTRQLRTTFGPPPEPPPPVRRVLRVLIVADPAEDARLPGAEAEGVEIADLFEAYNTVYAADCWNRVEVTRLLGPREATRTNVLRELMIRSYDVLHFAGHCLYDVAEPKSSGWIFTNNQRISAAELTRIDRVPRFIFSNACESGITPDRAEERTVDLAPTFAESFFERGVSNFVCTAWPVDDGAARLFALNLYAQLLGLRQAEDGSDRYERAEPASMVDAMKDSRLAIAPLDGGVRTWGAYQHYGNPYFRFFAPKTTPQDQPKGEANEGPTTTEPPAAPRKGGNGRRKGADSSK